MVKAFAFEFGVARGKEVRRRRSLVCGRFWSSNPKPTKFYVS